MERSSITLTVLFDAPFWVGIFERIENDDSRFLRSGNQILGFSVSSRGRYSEFYPLIHSLLYQIIQGGRFPRILRHADYG